MSDENRTITMFRVVRSERTRIEVNERVLGWGVQFPSNECYVDWNREAYDEENRLEHPHISAYGCLPDVRQGTGGNIEICLEHDVGDLNW